MENEKLKTLKELENYDEEGNWYDDVYGGRVLRAEAIKWVKFYQKHDEETEEAAQWLRMWIVKFFNLTEEELEE